MSQRQGGLQGKGSGKVERYPGTQTFSELVKNVLTPRVGGREKEISQHCSVTVFDRVVVSVNF